MNRLRAGTVLVRNPVHRTTVYRMDITPKNVDCIVFMTKDPRPIIPYLKEIGSMGYMYVFQITVTPYGREVEPGVPFKADIADAFRELSERIGRDRVVWRYDPIILNKTYTPEYHRRKFDTLCREFHGYTDRCIFSYLDMYGKLGKYERILRSATKQEKDEMGRILSEVASNYGISLSNCCDDVDLTKYGIEQRGCIDRAWMRSLDIPYVDSSSPLRTGCKCVRVLDVGAYDTCHHGCIYCYANSADPDRRCNTVFDPDNELLVGEVEPRDEVVSLPPSQLTRLGDF